MTNEINNAIELLSELCRNTNCRQCQLYTEEEGCLLRCDFPYQWTELIKEINKKAEEN